MQRRLLTIKETSEYLGITVSTLYHWVNQRKIEHIKVGRLVKFDIKTIDRFIDNNRVEPVSY